MTPDYPWVVETARDFQADGQDRETARDALLEVAWDEDVRHALIEVYGFAPDEWDHGACDAEAPGGVRDPGRDAAGEVPVVRGQYLLDYDQGGEADAGEP